MRIEDAIEKETELVSKSSTHDRKKAEDNCSTRSG